MRVAIVACNVIKNRLSSVEKVFGTHEIKIFTSDFSHTEKKQKCDEPRYDYIATKQYKKNLSIKRLISHIDFSKKVYDELRKFKPEIVYVQVPPNSLVKQCVRYRKESGCKLVFDLTDMWPESLPVSGIKKILALPIIRLWRKRRDKYIRHAELVITECDLFKKMLIERHVKLPNCETIYLCHDPIEVLKPDLPIDGIGFCYLGAINNIIDIDRIIALLCEINKKRKVRITIIGDGEMRESFIKSLQISNIEFNYMGKIYDANVKSTVFSQCHFGLNVYKKNLAIGLTIKSLDYFQCGLPIINTIKHDTWDLVGEYHAGINMENIENTAEEILALSNNDLINMRERVRTMFGEKFTCKIVQEKFEKILTSITPN